MTVPVSEGPQHFPTFQNQRGRPFWFKVLPFSLYTTPYVLMKLPNSSVSLHNKYSSILATCMDDMLISAHSPLNSPLAVGSLGIHSQCVKGSSDSIEADRLLGLHNRCQHNDHNMATSSGHVNYVQILLLPQVPNYTSWLSC